MKVEIFEHHRVKCFPVSSDTGDMSFDQQLFDYYKVLEPRIFQSAREGRPCFKIDVNAFEVHLEAGYYIGIDWLIEGKKFVHVKPKLNKQIINAFTKTLETDGVNEEESESIPEPRIDPSTSQELDFIKILVAALAHPVVSTGTSDLITIDWKKLPIEIEHKDDVLTPFLIVQFLNLLKNIVRKGLRKSYYRVQQNLTNRIKGKIVISRHLKQNVFKNRYTETYCDFQEFGINSQENQFLKYILNFAINYVASNSAIFKSSKADVELLLNFCRPAFVFVTDSDDFSSLNQIKANPFFTEYKEAVKIGKNILKRFSFNITNTAKEKTKSPPFWIDMPKLFELYVYDHILSVFDPKDIKFQFGTHGNYLDFLITKKGREMIIDAKYKMQYQSSQVHEDIRQVSGYARLNKVYKELNMDTTNNLIDCLIIYPSNHKLEKTYIIDLDQKTDISAYRKVFKLGVPMPYLDMTN